MNPSQLLAWLICLALAFFAAALAIRNSYAIALLEKDFVEVQTVANDRGEMLGEIRDILQHIERDLGGGRSAGASEADEPPAKPEPVERRAAAPAPH